MSQFIIPNVKTVNHGFECLKYLEPNLWGTIPSINSFKNFKNAIKKWKPGSSCPCRLCKIQIQKIGYM